MLLRCPWGRPLQVARAYKTLTDPVAKENFEKFGNPDGRQSLAVRGVEAR